jgi:cytochrome c6
VSCASSARAREPDARGLLKRALVSTVAAATLGASAAGAAWASEDPAGLFAKTCAGCHAAGGNVVAAGATLFPADLERNGVNDADTIYDLVYAGKNKMPGYGEGCQPRGQCTFGARLSDDDIRGVAEYVLEQSKSGWK